MIIMVTGLGGSFSQILRETPAVDAIAEAMMDTLGQSPEAWVCTSLSRMPLRSALLSYGGVTLVNGVVSMAAVCAMWSRGWL